MKHKEVVLKAHIKTWINEAFVITASIKAKLMQMQGTQEQMQGSSSDTAVSKQRVQEVQQAAAQCTTDLAAVRAELGGLRAKISTPTV